MQGVTLTTEELRMLLSCGCPDAAVLYLYRKAGLPIETALDALHFTVPHMIAATDCLRQLGLWESAAKPQIQPERPVYTDEALQQALHSDRSTFPKLVGEAQRRLGRTLSTEELKVLLGFTDYLRLPTDVVGLLLSYCVDRCRRRGVRPPSMRTIEKEAYHWADENIDNLETASYYIQTQVQIQTRVQQLRLMLQIDQRRLTSAEEQYITSWISMGFPDDTIRLAYERTCLNTGALKWAYMNSILKSWHEKGLHTPGEVKRGDGAPSAPPSFQRSKREQHAQNQELSPLARRAVQRALADAQQQKEDI